MNGKGASTEEIMELYNQMQPVTQVIFTGFLKAAFIAKTVSEEVALERATALMERHRAGGEVLISDIEAIGTP
jgi:hypothetical protein